MIAGELTVAFLGPPLLPDVAPHFDAISSTTRRGEAMPCAGEQTSDSLIAVDEAP